MDKPKVTLESYDVVQARLAKAGAKRPPVAVPQRTPPGDWQERGPDYDDPDYDKYDPPDPRREIKSA